jgi:hypothetical protein
VASCETGSPLVDAIKGFFDFLGDPIGAILDGIAKQVLSAAIDMFGTLTTSVPTLTGNAGEGGCEVADGGCSATYQDVSGETQWLVVYMAVGSLLVAAVRMAFERRGDAGMTALKGITRVIVVAGGASAVVTAAASLSDRYADYLFKAAAFEQMKNNIGCDGDDGGLTSFLLLILAFLLLLAGILHTILLYVRLGVMIVLLGTLPLAAAASMTDWGAGWWRKHIGWMVAWLMYKPAAGLVMYAGSAMISSDGEDASNERLAGIAVMLLSAVALPALLKLVVPATAALGGAGAVSGGMSAVGGAMASGARSVGSSPPSAASGPSGPSGASSGASGASSGGGGAGTGGAGTAGAAGASGGTGAADQDGESGGGASGARSPDTPAGAGGGGAAAGSRAGAVAGPAGAAIGAAIGAAKIAGDVASKSIQGGEDPGPPR